MHRPTALIYDGIAPAWQASRGEAGDDLGRRFREQVGEGLIVDLGCGPGRYLGQLGSPVLAVDVSRSMLSLASRYGHPRAHLPAGVGNGLCVVGNLAIDMVLRDIAEMPAWGQEVFGSGRLEAVGGQAANMAMAAAHLGVATRVIATVGQDAAGVRTRAELAEAGVDVTGVEVVPGGTTALTVAAVRPDGERAFLSDFGCLKQFDSAVMARHWPGAGQAAVLALVGTSNLPNFNLHEAAAILAEAQRYGVFTVFDPGWDPDGWALATRNGIEAVLAYTDLFLPNQDEAAALTGETEPVAVLRALSGPCPGAVVVKFGAAGSYYLAGDRLIHATALPTTVDNAVGAGDVYNAGLVAGHLRGGDIVDGMALATATASVYVSRRTRRFPTLAEVSPLVSQVVVRTERRP